MSLLLTSYVLSAYSLVWTGVSPARLPSYTNSPRLPKPLLLTLTAIGSFSAMPCLPLSSSSPLWVLVVLFAICANVGFGASVVASTSLHSQALPRKSCRHEEISRRFCSWLHVRPSMPLVICKAVRVSPDADCRKTNIVSGRSAWWWPLRSLETPRPWPPCSAPLRVPYTALILREERPTGAIYAR